MRMQTVWKCQSSKMFVFNVEDKQYTYDYIDYLISYFRYFLNFTDYLLT